MEEIRRQLLLAELEKARIKILADVVKQYTEEARYNYKQYIHSVHAASLEYDSMEEKLIENLKSELREEANMVEAWLKSKNS